MRYLSVAIAVATLLAFGGVAQASPTTHSSPSVRSFSGRIESIDRSHSTFVVRKEADGKVMEKEFHVDPNSWITLDGAINTLGSLEPGDSVTVEYRTTKSMK